jgi:capsular polysaccharide transport system ATP-binding protein
MIRVENISKHYVVQGRKKTVLKNLSFELKPKGKIALVGRNGAGKSTLLNILCGVESPNSGRVTRQGSLSWPVGASGSFMGKLTGRENAQFICRMHSDSKQEMKKKILYVQDFAEIGDYFDMPVSTYSSGMRSRLALGLSMAFDFDYYVVDETLSAGDEAFKNKCLEEFEKKAKNSGLIMVSHNMGMLKKFCNIGLFLGGGEVTYYPEVSDAIQCYHNLLAKKSLSQEEKISFMQASQQLDKCRLDFESQHEQLEKAQEKVLLERAIFKNVQKNFDMLVEDFDVEEQRFAEEEVIFEALTKKNEDSRRVINKAQQQFIEYKSQFMQSKSEKIKSHENYLKARDEQVEQRKQFLLCKQRLIVANHRFMLLRRKALKLGTKV